MQDKYNFTGLPPAVEGGYKGLKEINFPPSTLETIDYSVYDYMNDTINFHVTTNKGFEKVPVIWVASERAYQIKNKKELRDNEGTIILPAVTIERVSVTKDLTTRGVYYGDQFAKPDEKGGGLVIARKIQQKKTAEFNNAATQNPTFTPARVGTYTVTCTVSDDATPKLSASHPQSAFVGTALAGKITSSAGGAIDTTDFTTQELTASQTGAGTGGESYVWEVLRPDGTSGSTEYSSFSTSPLSQSCIFTPAQKGIHVHSVRMTDSSGEFVVLTASADYGTEIPYNRIQVMDFDGWTIVTGSLANTNEAEACFITCENGIVTYGHGPILGNAGEVPLRNLTEPKQFPVQLYSPENYLQNRLAPAMHSLGKEGKAGTLFLTMETVPNEDGTGKTSFSGLASGSVQSNGSRIICVYGIVSQPYNGNDDTPDFTLMQAYGHTSATNYTVQPRLSVGNQNENVKTLTNRSPGNASRVHLDAAIFIDNRGDPSIITLSPRESDGTVYGQENDSGSPTDFSDNVTGSRLYVGIGLASTSTCTDASGSFRLFWNFVTSQSGSSETGTGANDP